VFERLLHRGPRIGAEVTVLVGPYAGYVGRISEIDFSGRFRVFIDDCCQPLLEASELTIGRSRSAGDKVATARRTIEQNTEVEYARTMADAHVQPDDRVT
jgi:hypothetical protein